MIVDKAAALAAGGFDPMFTAAGDDVDFSWRLAARKLTDRERSRRGRDSSSAARLSPRMSNSSAVTAAARACCFANIHCRPTAGAMYGGDSWLGGLFGGARIYYGAFGRGLFQSVYPNAETSPLLQLPLTIPWVATADHHDRGWPGERADGVAGMGRRSR